MTIISSNFFKLPIILHMTWYSIYFYKSPLISQFDKIVTEFVYCVKTYYLGTSWPLFIANMKPICKTRECLQDSGYFI